MNEYSVETNFKYLFFCLPTILLFLIALGISFDSTTCIIFVVYVCLLVYAIHSTYMCRRKQAVIKSKGFQKRGKVIRVLKLNYQWAIGRSGIDFESEVFQVEAEVMNIEGEAFVYQSQLFNRKIIDHIPLYVDIYSYKGESYFQWNTRDSFENCDIIDSFQIISAKIGRKIMMAINLLGVTIWIVLIGGFCIEKII